MPDPLLLTPGPLTTARTTKEAMLHDWSARDPRFIALTDRIRQRLVALAGGSGSFECVPMQGSGTFAIEATLGSLIPRETTHTLVLSNGAYGARMAAMLEVLGRRHQVLDQAEDRPIDPTAVEKCLRTDDTITHVLVVYCETTAGIRNPLEAIARVTAHHGRSLIVDAMSAFGALPLQVEELPCDAVVASANKCLEGVPGVAYTLVRRTVLERCAGNAHSVCLDLHAQWRGLEDNGQWRFTPPTQVLAALDHALKVHAEEGGVEGRGNRYRENCKVLLEGMGGMGFKPLIPSDIQAPIIVTFHMPADERFDFQQFYERLSARGFLIYPGQLTSAPSFRVGCIGRLSPQQMRAAVEAVREIMAELDVQSGAPAA